MLTQYIQAAMRRAHYEIFEEDHTFYGEIPGFQGVWANGIMLEECRMELQEVLETWMLVRLSKNHPLPVVDGIDLSINELTVN